MNLKKHLISASVIATKSVESINDNHLVLFTDSTAIIGDLLSDDEEVESNPIYSGLFKGLTSANKVFDQLLKDKLEANQEKPEVRESVSRMRKQEDEIVYLQNVTIQSLSTSQTLNVDFLAVDLTTIVGFTVGSSSSIES